MRANKQKQRVHKVIRQWYVSECKKALENEEVIPDWRAVWKGIQEFN